MVPPISDAAAPARVRTPGMLVRKDGAYPRIPGKRPCLAAPGRADCGTMNPSVLIPGIIGAVCGALGWLLVGLYMARRQYARTAKNAGRAVYFELEMNRLSVEVALDYGAFTPLGRSSFDRLLPELATWLAPEELQRIVAAYMGHAGYGQLISDSDLPTDVRREALAGILGAQARALEVLRRRVFSEEEARRMERAQSSVAAAEWPATKDDLASTGA